MPEPITNVGSAGENSRAGLLVAAGSTQRAEEEIDVDEEPVEREMRIYDVIGEIGP